MDNGGRGHADRSDARRFPYRFIDDPGTVRIATRAGMLEMSLENQQSALREAIDTASQSLEERLRERDEKLVALLADKDTCQGRAGLAAINRLANDLAKEANWLVLDDGRPAIIDFQLAVRGDPRSRWMRLLARQDLRHLLKHKRMYCAASLTPVEKRVLKRTSWLRELWFRTGKPVYRFITRRLLKWEDNEGQGPKP